MAFDVALFDNGIFDGSVLVVSGSLSGAGQFSPSSTHVAIMDSAMQAAGVLAAGALPPIVQALATLHSSGVLSAHFTAILISSQALEGAGSQNSAMTAIKTLPELLMQGGGVLSQPFSLRVLVNSFIGQGAGALSVGIYFGLLPTVARSTVEIYTVATLGIELNTLAEQYQTLGEKLQ